MQTTQQRPPTLPQPGAVLAAVQRAGTAMAPAPATVAAAALKCRICVCRLNAAEDDDLVRELCASCKTRPEARRLGLQTRPAPSAAGATWKPGVVSAPASTPGSAALRASARDFTEAERSLIRKVHGYIPAQQLLVILNERLACDLGPDAMPYQMDQLRSEICEATGTAAPVGGHGWASLRKLIAQARRSGVLAAIDEQVINDFAVVFSLNPKQVLHLKDIVLQSTEDEA